MTNNPWKKISSKIIYSNPWITLREDQVIKPDGEPGIYSVVETRIATGVVALDNENNIYLVGQYRYPLDYYSWEIIEGGAEDNETALEAAKRELLEEAGLKAKNWIQLGSEIHLSNCHSSEVGFLFLATDLEILSANPDETEVLQIKKIPFESSLAMLESGEITDCMTIIGLERAKRYINDRI